MQTKSGKVRLEWIATHPYTIYKKNTVNNYGLNWEMERLKLAAEAAIRVILLIKKIT